MSNFITVIVIPVSLVVMFICLIWISARVIFSAYFDIKFAYINRLIEGQSNGSKDSE